MTEATKKEKAKAGDREKGPEPRMQILYRDKVYAQLKEQFGYTNPMTVPALKKVMVNMGVGKAVENKARIEHAVREMGMITGQRPATTLAKHSVAGFKLREGVAIGCAVTLRGATMWEFFDRLVSVAIPRIRDFRGLRNKLDGRGNYTMGLSEQSVFPEIDLDKVEFVQGMNITFVTSAKTDEEGIALLRGLGIPFKK